MLGFVRWSVWTFNRVHTYLSGLPRHIPEETADPPRARGENQPLVSDSASASFTVYLNHCLLCVEYEDVKSYYGGP